MFDAPVAKNTSPEQVEAAEEAFGTLLGVVETCQDNRQLPSGDTRQFALLAWTMVHGIAKLATAKRLPRSILTDRPAVRPWANRLTEIRMLRTRPVPVDNDLRAKVDCLAILSTLIARDLLKIS